MEGRARNHPNRACCSTLEQLCLNRKLFTEKERQAPVGWKISQVEKLVGLPRRDVQRSCYEGEGGVGILVPKNGSWGKRTYTKEDLATLFLVAEIKREGLSLPEVKCKLESELAEKAGEAEAASKRENKTATKSEAAGRAKATGKGEATRKTETANKEEAADESKITSEAKTAALLSLHEWRIAEESEAVYGRLLRAKALRASLDKDGAQEVRWLVWRTIECSFAENLDTLAQPRMQLAQMFFETCEAMVNRTEGSSENKRGDKVRGGSEGDGKAVDAKMNALFSAMENESWPRSHVQQDFAYALEMPGLDLAIELWLGLGSFESVRKAFENELSHT